jgi:hypothetical protein
LARERAARCQDETEDREESSHVVPNAAKRSIRREAKTGYTSQPFEAYYGW